MPFRRAVVLLAAGVLLPWGAGPVSAAELRLTDATGDMWASGTDGAAVPAPEAGRGDLTRAKLSYRGDTVVVRLAFAALARRGAYAQYTLLLQGKRDRRIREVVVGASPKRWAGRTRVFELHGDLVTHCPVSHEIDYGADVLKVRVKRTCLAKPGSVRANINVDLADDTGVFYSDNPHDGLDHSEAWTPWVRRSR